jgi:arylsulfatase A-like enzyme
MQTNFRNSITRGLIAVTVAGFGCIFSSCTSNQETKRLPNIVIIYADDLGYGDIVVNGAKGVKTPNIDLLASKGVNFTDAHCSAATCTPSRYSLLTGSYAFRKDAEILDGDAPFIISENQGTLPEMLKRAGYTTGVVGKWHLGLGSGQVNWNERVSPGPGEIGFDYSFLIPATGDRVPCVFLENQKVVGLEPDDPIRVSYHEKLEEFPTGADHPELLMQKPDLDHSNTIVNGISRIGFMSGGRNALWVDEDFPVVLTDKAKMFIMDNRENPFFLFMSFHDIHVPRVPNQKFKGKSSMGLRGDAIVQMDWCTGQIIEELEKLGLAENTLVIFTSDNGPVLDDGYADQAVELLGAHQPSGPFNGGKYSAYEAGTRMPTIVYWPGTVKPGKSNALLTQVDWFASLAKLVGEPLAANEAPDSFEQLDAWLGRTDKGREAILEEAFTFSLRKGQWKYIHPQEQVFKIPDWLLKTGIDLGLSPLPQLYDLAVDIAEETNLADDRSDILNEMKTELLKIRNTPYTRKGYQPEVKIYDK